MNDMQSVHRKEYSMKKVAESKMVRISAKVHKKLRKWAFQREAQMVDVVSMAVTDYIMNMRDYTQRKGK